VREKYCWLVADKPSEQGDRELMSGTDSLYFASDGENSTRTARQQKYKGCWI
jgi:hypothetical protein